MDEDCERQQAMDEMLPDKNASGFEATSAGSASASAIATLTDTDGSILVTMLQQDSAGYDVLVSMSVSAGTVTASNGAALDWQIAGGTIANGTGALVDDNKTDDTDIIVTVASTVAGVDETTISTLTTTGNTDASTWVALSTSYTANTTWAAGNLYTGVTVERTDVITAEDSVDAAASNATAAVKLNRVTWLG